MAALVPFASLAALTLIFVGAPASALQITGLTVTLTGNSPDSLTNSGNNRQQIAASTSVLLAPGGPVADTPGSMIAFAIRYASLHALDREGGGSSAAVGMTSNYQITFTVDNPSGGTYQLDIDTLRVGELTFVDDHTGSATATLGGVTGQVDGTPDSNFTLAAVGPTTANTGFSQAGTTVSIVDNALSRTFVLSFAWTSSVNSTQDEAAIRMGISGSLSTTTADDYPGVGSRPQSVDGHFTDVTLTLLTPEADTSALLAFGLLALAVKARADRRTRKLGRAR